MWFSKRGFEQKLLCTDTVTACVFLALCSCRIKICSSGSTPLAWRLLCCCGERLGEAVPEYLQVFRTLMLCSRLEAVTHFIRR